MIVEPLLLGSRDKLFSALDLLFASADAYSEFDPAVTYTPKEREPFDALCDRFLRSFESSLKFFRTWERVRESGPSDTFRDLLLRMEKLGFISSAQTWLTMRDLRNRIAHEYLPEELQKIYSAIVDSAVPEMRRLASQVSVSLAASGS